MGYAHWGMDEFEEAVQVVFSRSPAVSEAARERATAYCDAIKRRPDCYRLCWAQFSRNDSLEVKFWCLQTVTAQLPTLLVEGCDELRACVLERLRDAAPHRQEEVAVRNKLALVYVGLLARDYPTRWPSAWTDLLVLLDTGPALVDMFLRICTIFDQELISEEVPRSEEEQQRALAIRHAMGAADVGRLAECWYTILRNFRQSATHLVVECLKVVFVWGGADPVPNSGHDLGPDGVANSLAQLGGHTECVSAPAESCVAAQLRPRASHHFEARVDPPSRMCLGATCR